LCWRLDIPSFVLDVPRHIISPVDCVVYDNNMFKNLAWLLGFGFCYVTALMPSESSVCTLSIKSSFCYGVSNDPLIVLLLF
jgi:hypothetical protein